MTRLELLAQAERSMTDRLLRLSDRLAEIEEWKRKDLPMLLGEIAQVRMFLELAAKEANGE